MGYKSSKHYDNGIKKLKQLTFLFYNLAAGDFAVLLTAGMSVKMALVTNLLSAMSCYIGLAIGIYIGQEADVRLWIFAIAAGMFLYIALVDMVLASLLFQSLRFSYRT